MPRALVVTIETRDGGAGLRAARCCLLPGWRPHRGWLLLLLCAVEDMGNAGEKKKAKANAETLLYAKIFIAVCHVRMNATPVAAPILLFSSRVFARLGWQL